MKNNLFLVGSIVSTLAFSANALAEMPAPYVGVGYGQFKFEFDNREIDSHFDDSNAVYKAYVGGNFTDFLGVEFTYMGFDEASDRDTDVDLDGLSLGLTLRMPVGERISVFLKGGLFKWEAEYSNTIISIPYNEKIDGSDMFYGAGASLGLTERVALRVDYDRYELDGDIDPKLDIASVAVQLSF